MWSATCTMTKNQKTKHPEDRHADTDCPDPRYPDDDGRVVADMSQVVRVHMMDLIAPEGLRRRLGGRRPGHPGQGAAQNPYGQNPYGQGLHGQNLYGQNPYGNGEPLELTDGELKALMKASLKAAMLLAGVFIAAAALLILFTVFVWFR